MSTSDSTTHNQCDWCGTPIRFGNPQVTVNRHVEQTNLDDASVVRTVTVIEAHTLLTLCARCGNRLDSPFLQDLLRAALPRRG